VNQIGGGLYPPGLIVKDSGATAVSASIRSKEIVWYDLFLTRMPPEWLTPSKTIASGRFARDVEAAARAEGKTSAP
jgi:hypothetical protein